MIWPERRNPKERYLVGVGNTAALFGLALCLWIVPKVAAGQSSAQSSAPSTARRLPVRPPEAGQQTFISAEEASQTLIVVVQIDPPPWLLLRVLGRSAKDIISSGDETEDESTRKQFVQKYRQMHRLVTEPDGTTTLYIGAENWPTPIPLVNKGNSWYFDSAAGKQEILYRRVGENELTVIQVCHELVNAQKEYYAQPRDGASGRQYAQKILSDPNTQNGLYWKTVSGEAESPLGPLIASAEREDYPENATQPPQPFHGYYFRVLTGQAPNAPGDARSYIVKGKKMTRGFAFLAYPAKYRSSGAMTFLVDQDGIVYEKDLGRKTAEIVKSFTRFSRDSTWRKAD
jgi:Protein of unknown function (DUF2950)